MTLFDSIIVIVEHLFLALASILLLTAGIAIAISLLVFFLELPDNIKKWLEKRKSDPDEEDEEISTVFIHKPLSNETRPQNNSETSKKHSRKTAKNGSTI